MAYPLKDWINLVKNTKGYRFKQKTFYSAHHLGLDITAPLNTPLFCWVSEMTIIESFFGVQGGWTAFVKIPGDERLFRFLHLAMKPKVGTYKLNYVFGFIGNTGAMSRGSHVHIDISKDGLLDLDDLTNFENPEDYFNLINLKPLAIKNMIVKQKGFPAIYALVGNVLIPFTNWEAYKADFEKEPIIELDYSEINKFTKAKGNQITPVKA